MRRVTALLCVSLAFACVATPQGRPVDWPSYGGDARRTGWEKSDVRITKDNVKDFQLVLKRKLENQQSGPYALSLSGRHRAADLVSRIQGTRLRRREFRQLMVDRCRSQSCVLAEAICARHGQIGCLLG